MPSVQLQCGMQPECDTNKQGTKGKAKGESFDKNTTVKSPQSPTGYCGLPVGPVIITGVREVKTLSFSGRFML